MDHELLKQYQSQPEAILLDVRQPDEYARGHVPGARNVPLQKLRDFSLEVADRDTPVYLYCLSGGRSLRAATALKGVGFTRVYDLGGINGYTGELEK
jgi:rhodanese-related sulfurtransferase